MSWKALIGWIALGVAAAASFVALFPSLLPFEPARWQIDRSTAEAIALERAADLGDVPVPATVVVTRESWNSVALRLRESQREGVPIERLRESRAADLVRVWQVSVHDDVSPSSRWSHRVRLSAEGQVLQLERQVSDSEARGLLDPTQARARADRLLESHGYEPASYGEPDLRVLELENRTDTLLRYVDQNTPFGEEVRSGLEVRFAGDQLLGFDTWFDDERKDEFLAPLRGANLLEQGWVFLPILLLPLVAVPFVRRYHAGKIGVQQGLRIAGVVLVSGLAAAFATAKGISADASFGGLSKPQVIVAIMFQFSVVFYFPMALLAFLSWSVGESLCREKWGHKLAGFDALFRGAWNNATFARAALRGVACGFVILALFGGALRLLGERVVAFGLGMAGPGWDSVQWVFVPTLAFGLAYALYSALFGQLFLVTWLARRLGRVGGPVAAAALGALCFFPVASVFPLPATFALGFLVYGGLVLVFLKYGIFAGVMAQLTITLMPAAARLYTAGHSTMELNAALLLLAVLAPLLLSFKHILSNREFVYRYDDVPKHVRQIAERERQKVELETARGIQSSILPELPPELNGVKLAHRYRPASEVGGDFYDVLALEDGRLAIAVGDVAGHGVSSGLVMSMAKSALAVQVTFDPEVESVFRTVNKMVFQSARKRLLTTLCYALIDPREREMYFASAGHLFPYRVSSTGRVEALESISYPLGVRDTIDVRTRAAKLDSGDKLFLYSDGVVEASPEGSVELFGFERLEESLERHATSDVRGMRDGVLGDLEAFVGRRQLDDDLTVLVLEVP